MRNGASAMGRQWGLMARQQEERTSMTTPPQTSPETKYYRIDEVAERTGMTRRTLRYYEEIGLLPAPVRTEGNYRLYTDADIARLEHIRRLKDSLNLSLREVQEMVRAEEEAQAQRATFWSETDVARRQEALDRLEEVTRNQVALIDEKMRQLRELQQSFVERLERIEVRRGELRDRGVTSPPRTK